MFSWLYLIPVAILVFLGGFGWNFVTSIKDQAATITQLQHQVDLDKGTLDSYKRMVDRRDAAIKASKCSVQIAAWVKNPDSIPVPFNPFNQLDPANTRTP